ncbi:MAG: asparagine synthase-related protein [Candidatus Thorarchaeota archaeon]
MVKLTLQITNNKDTQFFEQMREIFSLFRGDTFHELSGNDYQAFLQLDSKVNDGLIWENDDVLFIELGINYTKAGIEDRISACLEEDEQKLRRTIDGEVCQIILSKKTNRVTITTDPYGLLPLYYAKSKDDVIISTDLKGVLAVDPNLRLPINRQSVMEYLTLHSIMDNRTLFDSVFLIAEGSTVKFSLNKLDKWNVEDWYTLPKAFEEKPLKEWFKIVYRELNAAVKKRERPGIGAFLSGGMDSRTILALISPEIRSTIRVLTFGVEGSDDLRNAERVAKRFEVKWCPVILNPDESWKDALKHMWISDGASNHLVASILEAVRQVGVDSILDGTPGDANFGGGYATNMEDLFDAPWPYTRSKYALKWLQYKGIARKLKDVAQLMKETTEDSLAEHISNGLESELKRLPDDMTPICQLENSLYRIRVRRNTMGGQYSVDSISVSLKPYYDVQLHESFLKIPARERRSHLFLNRFVQATIPEVLLDPTTRALPLQTTDVLKRKIFRYVRAIARRFGLRILESKPYLDASKLMGENSKYRKWLFSILDDERTKARGFVDTDAAVKMLQDHDPGITDYSILLTNAIDLEIVLRLFSDGDGFRTFGILK